MKKRLLPFLLGLVMVLTLVPAIALADGSSGNVSLAVDKTTANVGDTITVTLSNKAMTVGTFTCGMKFDKGMLECSSIAQGANYGAVTAGAALIEPQLSTVALANKNGTVGFGVVRTANQTVAAGDLLVVQFKVLKSGSVTITAYESSCKADSSGAVSTENANTVMVTVDEVGETILGDVSGDNKITMVDVTQMRQYLTNQTKYPLKVADAADVNVDGKITMVDVTRLRQYLTNKDKYPLGKLS